MPRSCQTGRSESFCCHPPWQILILKVSWTFVRAQIHASWFIWTISRVATLKLSHHLLPRVTREQGTLWRAQCNPWYPNPAQGAVCLSGDFTVGVSSPSLSARPCRYFTLETLSSKFPPIDCSLAFPSCLFGFPGVAWRWPSPDCQHAQDNELCLCSLCRVIWDQSWADCSQKDAHSGNLPGRPSLGKFTHFWMLFSDKASFQTLQSQEAWSQGDVTRLDCECLGWFWLWEAWMSYDKGILMYQGWEEKSISCGCLGSPLGDKVRVHKGKRLSLVRVK